MFDQLDDVVTHFKNLEAFLSSPEATKDTKQFSKLSKEHRNLEQLVNKYLEYKNLTKDFEQNRQIIQEGGELKDLAVEENRDLEERIPLVVQQLRVLLLPKDPNDEKNVLLEIRAGAGGDEASLFVGELFRMYSKYAEKNGWKVEVMSESQGVVGGFKEIICMIHGERVYSRLKYESGVHRVQRVPRTETQGRIHTSTVTVAVLPEAEDVEVNIDPSELRIDVFRSSGPGGQSVNTTDSAVRVTHLPTSLVVSCQDEKSQHKNKAKALKILKTRLLDLKQREQQEKIASERKSQVGTGDRSEKIRTYNFPQGRITDHRINFNLHNMEGFMNGGISELIDQLQTYYEAEALKSQTVEGTIAEMAGTKKT